MGLIKSEIILFHEKINSSDSELNIITLYKEDKFPERCNQFMYSSRSKGCEVYNINDDNIIIIAPIYFIGQGFRFFFLNINDPKSINF